MKAVITAAGKHHSHLPLQTIADEAGQPLSILSHQLQALRDAGVDQVGIIINPKDLGLYEDAISEYGDFVECICQDRPQGYANAILCAEAFVGNQNFLLSVADHLFVGARGENNCFRQLIDASHALNCSVSAVQATSESEIRRFGTVGGERVEGKSDLVRIAQVIEKPTPTLAEQKLFISGLRAGHYYAYFGIHVLTPGIFAHLREAVDSSEASNRVTLTDAVNRMLAEEDFYALEVKGERFDLEAPFGLLHGQLAQALNGSAREQILADLLGLVAR